MESEVKRELRLLAQECTTEAEVQNLVEGMSQDKKMQYVYKLAVDEMFEEIKLKSLEFIDYCEDTGCVIASKASPALIIPNRNWMLPKALVHRWWVGDLIDVVNQNVQTTLLLINSLEEGANRFIIVVIQTNRNRFAAELIGGAGGGFNGHGRGRNLWAGAAAGKVDRATILAQTFDNAFADAFARAGDDGDFSC